MKRPCRSRVFLVLASVALAAGFAACGRWARYQPGKTVAPESIPFRAGPFVQPVDTGGSLSCAVWWFDPDAANAATVWYGLSPERQSMREAREKPGDGRRHEVVLCSLQRGMRYYYSVPGFDEKVYSFTTPPENDGAVRFLCFGDTENTASDRKTMSYYSEILDRARDFYAARGMPHCMIHLGDLVKFGSDLKAWNDFFRDTGDFAARTPFAPVLGNHEIKGDNGAHYDYFFSGRAFYSFDMGNVHVLVLHPFDGMVLNENGPWVSSSMRQYRFARADLKKNRDKRWIVAAIHIPLLSTGDFGLNRMLIQQYFRLFRENRVDLVLSGHDHVFDSFHVDREELWGGTWYIVCGTGGSRLDSYIMTRKQRRWKSWIHDSLSGKGPYQNDRYAAENHVYGELSWGFMDIECTGNEMALRYYRWLSFPRFLEITGQDAESWKIVPIAAGARRTHGLGSVELIKEIRKRRNF